MPALHPFDDTAPMVSVGGRVLESALSKASTSIDRRSFDPNVSRKDRRKKVKVFADDTECFQGENKHDNVVTCAIHINTPPPLPRYADEVKSSSPKQDLEVDIHIFSSGSDSNIRCRSSSISSGSSFVVQKSTCVTNEPTTDEQSHVSSSTNRGGNDGSGEGEFNNESECAGTIKTQDFASRTSVYSPEIVHSDNIDVVEQDTRNEVFSVDDESFVAPFSLPRKEGESSGDFNVSSHSGFSPSSRSSSPSTILVVSQDKEEVYLPPAKLQQGKKPSSCVDSSTTFPLVKKEETSVTRNDDAEVCVSKQLESLKKEGKSVHVIETSERRVVNIDERVGSVSDHTDRVETLLPVSETAGKKPISHVGEPLYSSLSNSCGETELQIESFRPTEFGFPVEVKEFIPTDEVLARIAQSAGTQKRVSNFCHVPSHVEASNVEFVGLCHLQWLAEEMDSIPNKVRNAFVFAPRGLAPTLNGKSKNGENREEGKNIVKDGDIPTEVFEKDVCDTLERAKVVLMQNEFRIFVRRALTKFKEHALVDKIQKILQRCVQDISSWNMSANDLIELLCEELFNLRHSKNDYKRGSRGRGKRKKKKMAGKSSTCVALENKGGEEKSRRKSNKYNRGGKKNRKNCNSKNKCHMAELYSRRYEGMIKRYSEDGRGFGFIHVTGLRGQPYDSKEEKNERDNFRLVSPPRCTTCLQNHEVGSTKEEQQKYLLEKLTSTELYFHVCEFTARKWGPPLPGMRVTFRIGVNAKGYVANNICLAKLVPDISPPMPLSINLPSANSFERSYETLAPLHHDYHHHRRNHSWPMVGSSPSVRPMVVEDLGGDVLDSFSLSSCSSGESMRGSSRA
eukprot:g2152.t1